MFLIIQRSMPQNLTNFIGTALCPIYRTILFFDRIEWNGNSYFFRQKAYGNNKIISNSLSMLKTNGNMMARKKLEDYSYCLGHNIGKGYSSQVFKGKNDVTDQTVAIKVIDMRMLKGEVHRNLLTSEINVLKSFKRCSNIIQVFDIYTTKNNTYIITEYCQGGDLSKMISGKQGMSETHAINLLKQIVSGYLEISSNRVIHRDLKPANILVKDNQVKIADFGFAMKASESKIYSEYNVGSPIYMPPEALNSNKYSYKSDIWAIGVIFFELLTGRTPWRAKTEKDLGKQLVSVPVSRLLPKSISSVSQQFLERTLCVNYDRRMNLDELDCFMNRFDSCGAVSGFAGTQTSIRPLADESGTRKKHETSLNKNIVRTPKNVSNFNFLRTTEENMSAKNMTLPKTASTINNQTSKTLDGKTDNKELSKELLSQIHLCRFVYKLLQRMNLGLEQGSIDSLKADMCSLLFWRLDEIHSLRCVNDEKSLQYRRSQEFRKICQIVEQYQKKYEKDLGSQVSKWEGFQALDHNLLTQIKSMYAEVKEAQGADKLSQHHQKVIILDYLVTLKQLAHLLQMNDIEQFHAKSKIETIVEGCPARNITGEHVRAISNKLRSIKVV